MRTVLREARKADMTTSTPPLAVGVRDQHSRLLQVLAGPPAHRAALRMIRRGVHSRVEIARETGLDSATITRAVSALLDAGVIEESDVASDTAGRRGRPTRQLRIVDREHWAIGIHLGVRGAAVSAIGLGGSSLASVVCHHDGTAADAVAACVRGIEQLRSGLASAPVGVGIAVGGRVDSEHGRIASMPRLGWRDVPIAAEILAATGLPCTVHSMAQAQAQANVVHGQVGPDESFGHLYVGYIVEYAVVIGGDVWAPTNGPGGDVDELLLRASDGTVGAVRELVSDDGVLQRARESALVGPDADFDDVLTALSDPVLAPRVEDLLATRAANVAALVRQLQTVITLPTLVLSASLAREEGALDRIREALATDDADAVRLISGGPVELVNPRSGACGHFEALFTEATA